MNKTFEEKIESIIGKPVLMEIDDMVSCYLDVPKIKKEIISAVRELVEEVPTTYSRNASYANGFRDAIEQYKHNMLKALERKEE